jgi:hypothetical protein
VPTTTAPRKIVSRSLLFGLGANIAIIRMPSLQTLDFSRWGDRAKGGAAQLVFRPGAYLA